MAPGVPNKGRMNENKGIRKAIFFMNRKEPIAGVILAAGASRRLGTPKQLITWRGKHLIERVLDVALRSRLDSIVLVLGHESETILEILGDRIRHERIEVAINHEHRVGMSGSLRLGLSLVQETHPSVMFLLGDQPFVNSDAIDLLLKRFLSSEKEICVPVHRGKRGNPTIFSRKYYRLMMDIKGDVGAREIIRTHPEDVLQVEMDNPLSFFDVDTRADLEILQAMDARQSS